MRTLFGPSPDHEQVTRPTEYEQQEYHDFLERFMSSQCYQGLPAETKLAVVVCRDTLCWTLGHANETFATNMRSWGSYFTDQHGWHDTFNN